MKYVITGGAGHISKPLAQQLLAAGHQVIVIGRNEQHLLALKEEGAATAIGSVEDISFLKDVFAGADAVYTMVPPKFDATDWKGWIANIGRNYADAIKATGVSYVVNLSSVGAEHAEGCGPVSGLHSAENALNALSDVSILHLRPGYFFDNLLSNIPMVKGMNIIGGNFSNADDKVILASPADIADVAAQALLKLDFTGHSVRYIASDERTPNDIAKTLGTAIGNPQLPFIVFSDEDTLNGMKGAGLPEEVAKNYTEMGHAMRTGKMGQDYWKHRPEESGKVKLEDFARQFAEAYQSN